jgi:hypothetical protein
MDRLADVLACENAALLRLDLPAATSLIAEKDAAIRLLSSDEAAVSMLEPPETAQRLLALTQTNHELLKRAIAVQARVIEIVAQAYRPPDELRRYGPDGVQTAARSPAVAVCKRV